MPKNIIWFVHIAVWEAISYILLLGIAMPLKYIFDYPLAVTLVGWAHGVLFMLYMIFLFLCWQEFSWSFKRVVIYFIASLLPLVPLYIKRKLVQEYKA
ncbi:MAG TPA: DUF3817 domain-containing protein [Cyclobacteriaceae bacterium]|nr:DUF3817 domain-containing protein [Cyclobacteriaceae bacterium]